MRVLDEDEDEDEDEGEEVRDRWSGGRGRAAGAGTFGRLGRMDKLFRSSWSGWSCLCVGDCFAWWVLRSQRRNGTKWHLAADASTRTWPELCIGFFSPKVRYFWSDVAGDGV